MDTSEKTQALEGLLKTYCSKPPQSLPFPEPAELANRDWAASHFIFLLLKHADSPPRPIWATFEKSRDEFLSEKGIQIDLQSLLARHWVRICDGEVRIAQQIQHQFMYLRDFGKGKPKPEFWEKLHLRFALMPFLMTVIEQGILNGKINANTLIRWLAEKTWLGQILEEPNAGSHIRKYNWLGLLAPSLLEFFVQKEASLKSKNVFTNYVLCIDSITPKFEGILRDFAKRAGINTLTTRNGQVREMYIEDILGAPKIGGFFHENDLAFFQYLFTASGVNLRNNVAHSYFRFQNYSEGYMILLILAILRFGRYRLKESRNSQAK